MIAERKRNWTAQSAVACVGLAALLAATGCTDVLSGIMVEAPNKGRTFDPDFDPGSLELALHGVDHQLRVPVGPPDASLLVWVMEPKASEQAGDAVVADGRVGKRPDADHDSQSPAKPLTTKGTILVLHGYRAEKFWLLGKARTLADAGYRAVLVDLRGNGRSSGDYITFGQHEARDLAQVVDALEEQDLLAWPLGVWGNSYGAATAIQYAAHDPRVRAVVAVAPFATLREVAPPFIRTMLPVPWRLMKDADVQAVVDRGGEMAGFDPDLSDTLTAIRQIQAPVLLLHGTSDALIPADHSRQLYEAATDAGVPVELILLDHHGHIGIFLDPTQRVAKYSPAWFDHWLNANPAAWPVAD